MRITIKQEEVEKLLKIVKKELNFLVPREGLELETDPYWYIMPSEWGVMDKDLQPALGMLSEDWEFLQRVLSGEEPFTTLALEKFAFLLMAIGETIIPTKSE